MAAFLIPPGLEANQALRLRRVGLAASAYALAGLLLAVACAFGVLTARAAWLAGAAALVAQVGVYAAIRSGRNLRLPDPSLTGLQIVIAITLLMFVIYNMDDGRNVALFGCFVIFAYGVFRLAPREFAAYLLYTLAAYALVINLLMHLRPHAIQSAGMEWMSWLGLAGLLPCFAVVGGEISALRRRLRDSEARFMDLSELSSDFHWESDKDHRVTIGAFADQPRGVMPAFERGVRPGERRWEVPYLTPDEAGWKAHCATLDAHEPFNGFEFSRPGPDGMPGYLSINGKPLFDASGAFRGYRGVGTNITARKRLDQALGESAEKLRVFADNVPAMAAYWDRDLRCQFANKALLEFWGLAPGAVIGKRVIEIYASDIYREVEHHAAIALRGQPTSFQRTRALPNGETRFLEVRLVPHFAAGGGTLGYFSLTTDVTEHKLAQARIQRVAHHDDLTGLPNRLLFNDRLEQAIGRAKRNAAGFALLYLDLDRFKPVNDLLGHAAGDELLQAAGKRILQLVRESDTVARVGGDEFAVILPDVATREEARLVAGKIAAALALPFRVREEGRVVEIGVSIGVGFYPEDALDADSLVKVADAGMYGDKESRAKTVAD